LSDYWSCV